MRHYNREYVLFLSVFFVFLLFAQCKKEFSGVGVPEVITLTVSNITTSSVNSGGNLITENGFPVNSYGLLVSEFDDFRKHDTVDCTMQSGGLFTAVIRELKYNQTVYIRAWATNSMGTGYGEVIKYTHKESGISFNPDLTYDTLVDIEGNVYRTIRIGTQEWMAENLKATRFNDGTPIPYVPDNDDWKTLSSPGYSWYLNSEENYKITYGAMYNWWAAASGNICPAGWHVPDSNEFATLINYLGGMTPAGNKLKEKGHSHWVVTNEGDNLSGFTGVPGGYRDNTGRFYYNGHYGYHWSTTEHYHYKTTAHFLSLRTYDSIAYAEPRTTKQAGISIRCLRD